MAGLEWLKPAVVFGSMLYALIGVVIFWVCFVIVDKITTAIQDQFLSIDLERSGMVRGMSVDKIDSAVNELMCKARLFGLDAITPVGAPVCRDNHYVAGLSYLAYSAAQFIGERLCEGG